MNEKPVKATVTRVLRKRPVMAMSKCGEMVLIIGEVQDAEHLGFAGSMHPDEGVVQVSLQWLEESLAKTKAERLS